MKGGFTINVEGVYGDFEFFRGGGFEKFLSQNKTRYAEGGGSNCAEIVGFFITFKRHVIKLCLAATLYKLSASCEICESPEKKLLVNYCTQNLYCIIS